MRFPLFAFIWVLAYAAGQVTDWAISLLIAIFKMPFSEWTLRLIFLTVSVLVAMGVLAYFADKILRSLGVDLKRLRHEAELIHRRGELTSLGLDVSDILTPSCLRLREASVLRNEKTEGRIADEVA